MAICLTAFGLQVAGWVGIASMKLIHHPRAIRFVDRAFIVLLLAMGAVTLIAATFECACALTSGLTGAIMVLALLSGRHGQADPYTMIYARGSELTME